MNYLDWDLPADGNRAAYVGNRDFGTSPIFVQLSDTPLLARVYYVGCRNLKHNGRSRNYALAIAAWPRPVLGLLVEIPTALGIPLDFIINELITNWQNRQRDHHRSIGNGVGR